MSGQTAKKAKNLLDTIEKTGLHKFFDLPEELFPKKLFENNASPGNNLEDKTGRSDKVWGPKAKTIKRITRAYRKNLDKMIEILDFLLRDGVFSDLWLARIAEAPHILEALGLPPWEPEIYKRLFFSRGQLGHDIKKNIAATLYESIKNIRLILRHPLCPRELKQGYEAKIEQLENLLRQWDLFPPCAPDSSSDRAEEAGKYLQDNLWYLFHSFLKSEPIWLYPLLNYLNDGLSPESVLSTGNQIKDIKMNLVQRLLPLDQKRFSSERCPLVFKGRYDHIFKDISKFFWWVDTIYLVRVEVEIEKNEGLTRKLRDITRDIVKNDFHDYLNTLRELGGYLRDTGGFFSGEECTFPRFLGNHRKKSCKIDSFKDRWLRDSKRFFASIFWIIEITLILLYLKALGKRSTSEKNLLELLNNSLFKELKDLSIDLLENKSPYLPDITAKILFVLEYLKYETLLLLYIWLLRAKIGGDGGNDFLNAIADIATDSKTVIPWFFYTKEYLGELLIELKNKVSSGEKIPMLSAFFMGGAGSGKTTIVQKIPELADQDPNKVAFQRATSMQLELNNLSIKNTLSKLLENIEDPPSSKIIIPTTREFRPSKVKIIHMFWDEVHAPVGGASAYRLFLDLLQEKEIDGEKLEKIIKKKRGVLLLITFASSKFRDLNDFRKTWKNLNDIPMRDFETRIQHWIELPELWQVPLYKLSILLKMCNIEECAAKRNECLKRCENGEDQEQEKERCRKACEEEFITCIDVIIKIFLDPSVRSVRELYRRCKELSDKGQRGKSEPEGLDTRWIEKKLKIKIKNTRF